MCFYITKENPNPLLAAEDIVSYKVVNTDLTSFYLDFQYEIGETYKMEENLKIEIDIKKVKINYQDSLVIHEGFHSYMSYENINIPLLLSFEKYETVTIVKCVIPKGSTYYINEYREEYVSNNLKILKIIEDRQFKQLSGGYIYFK